MEMNQISEIWRVLASIPILAAIYGAFRMYQVRSLFRDLQRRGFPMPPHDPIWGHLKIVGSIMKDLPPDLMPTIALGDFVRRKYPHLDQAFYLDQWPFSGPLLVVISPDGARQMTQGIQLAKDPGQHDVLKPLTGGYDMDTMEGEEWKFWHNAFSPGFRVSNIMALLPKMVPLVELFCDRLRQQAQKSRDREPFLLSPMALDLTMDLSSLSIWGHELSSQTEYDDFADALASQLSWLHYWGSSLLKDMNFVRPIVHWYNSRRMNTYIDRVLAKPQNVPADEKASSTSILDLANLPKEQEYQRILPKVIQSQIKFMMLAGYDTTGSSIVFLIHLLSRHPEILAKVRAEHDEVFGTDPEAAPRLIAAQPKLLNQLPYTTAVMKESLRFFPPAATMRMGTPSFEILIDAPGGDGTDRGLKLGLPTKGCKCTVVHHGVHHNPRFWREPHRFMPERFLEGTVDSLRPPANGWRPFERGPRACIGQEMALTEIKLVCVMTAREFDFTPAYEEFYGPRSARKIDDDYVYLVSRGGAANPSGCYPCRVSARAPRG
ncbi:putative sterigmatocystin biosynthesis P450 monooxygenase stcS [Colletotrichum spinosum]|uniref:Putative sterigmatocystin biosynthesis P450 monooxygenase stcS n=1 Tax=Colletotrichum spinosum TaxID=1347390 RepID=A0A4R8Q642_9PEZI|nr:putative sterigmatocystin biosynthesis P450 monooxygenase stcS [Colletotrichum spinosum]